MRLLVVMLFAFLLLSGCGSRDGDEGARVADSTSWDKRLADRARLIDHLPEDTWAYVRMPNLWGLLSAPKGSALDAALVSEANQNAVAALQQQLRVVLERDFEGGAPFLVPLLEQLRSPLELVLAGDAEQPMNTAIILSGRFAYESGEALNAALESISSMHPAVGLVHGVSAERSGLMFIGPTEMYFSFDDDQRLTMVGGMAVDEALFRTMIDQPVSTNRSVHRFEQRIDASRQGMLLWADMVHLRPVLEQMATPEQLAGLQASGAMATDELAFGFGTSGGQGQLGLFAQGSRGLIWELAPQLPSMPAIGTSGDPRTVIGGVLPEYSWVVSLIDQLREADVEEFEEGLDSELAEADVALRELIGMSLEELVNLMAGRVFYISDDNGNYVVHTGIEPGAFKAFLESINEQVQLNLTSSRYNGRQIHHLAVPGMGRGMDPDDAANLNPLLLMIMGMESHFFWMAEDDHVVFASVPQVLMDRIKYPPDNALGDWLNHAGQSPDSAVMVAGMRVDGAARRNYYAYLSSLLGLGDMLGYQLDLMAFPSARTLGLAERGTVGLRLDYAEQQIGLSWTFENHPGDFLFGGGGAVVGVSAVAILAAVAVPAYQDYTLRARIQAGLIDATSIRQDLELFVLEHDRFPEDHEFELPPARSTHMFDYELVDTYRSLIVVDFEPASGLDPDAELWVEVDREDDGSLSWRCHGSGIAEKHLPHGCRD